MVRVEQEQAQQRTTYSKRFKTVTNENILARAKQDCLDGLLNLNGYQKKLRSLGHQYIQMFDTSDKNDLDYEPKKNRIFSCFSLMNFFCFFS